MQMIKLIIGYKTNLQTSIKLQSTYLIFFLMEL